MKPPVPLRRVETESGGKRYVLRLDAEDLSSVYPAMVRYSLTLSEGDRVIAAFRTNSYEYSPLTPLTALAVAERTADEWEDEIRDSLPDFIETHRMEPPQLPPPGDGGLVVIQGSPRAGGNCAILAGWAASAAGEGGRHAEVIYPHDLDIHCCIGCYQCYNTGHCIYEDDMAGIITAIGGASLILICSPVYTNTVPAGLKLVLDRCQSYHANRALFGGRTGQKGLIFSVAGRRGATNFSCVVPVLAAFFRNLGIQPAGEILLDGTDALRDIRTIPGLEQRVRETIRRSL